MPNLSRVPIDEDTQEFLDSIAWVFRDIRKELGMSQREAAKHLGITQARVSAIERAQVDIKISTLVHLAHAYNQNIKIEFDDID